MTGRHPAFFEGTEMPTAGWWETLWPEPARVLEAVGLKRNMDAVDLCCGDGWFTSEMAKVARRVLAIDLDRNMLAAARDRFIANLWKATPTNSQRLRAGWLISCSWRTPFTASPISPDWRKLYTRR